MAEIRRENPVEVRNVVVYPVVYKVLAPSNRWLGMGMGFLTHQQVDLRPETRMEGSTKLQGAKSYQKIQKS